MYLLYCDETNFQKLSGDFFVYGGIVIDGAKAGTLADALSKIRKSYDVPNEFLVKFNPGPQHLSHADFIGLKQAYIAAAAENDVLLLVNLLLHDIATSSDDARRFGINTLCYHFDCYLHRPKAPGLVLIDRFNDKKLDDQLKEKAAIGLTGPIAYSGEKKLKYIIGYHLSSIGQSHFCSLVDVVIGSLRFAINAFTQGKEEHMDSAGAILNQLSPLFFREGKPPGNTKAAVDLISFWFSPAKVSVAKYREKYLALRDFLQAQGIEIEQIL